MEDTHKNDKKCSCHGHGCGKKDKIGTLSTILGTLVHNINELSTNDIACINI